MAKIMVVDDRPVDREFLVTLLRYAGHDVIEAADGEQALVASRARCPDLLITDVLMPNMDGFRLVRELRADADLARIALLIYTASYDSHEAQDLAIGYGVSVLGKPADPEKILDAVTSALLRAPSLPVLPPEDFDRQHLRLLGDKLFQKAEALEQANKKLQEMVMELRAEVQARKEAEAAAEQQREWLHVVLSSIGDAVIATDHEKRVAFLNPVAEKMTGWRRSDAVGRTLDDVFHIVNEHTRQPADNPVDRVLREGVIVGLANHTVLIGRDGQERPIDDCASPIRGQDGGIRGVVLVFHDVSAQRGFETELRERAERLAEADRRKDEFLAMLAHELRNPLAPIRNSLYILQISGTDQEVLATTREVMRRQVDHLARLVDDLLDVTRITRGLISLRKERMDLVAVVRDALIDHQPRADASGIVVVADLPEAPIWLEGDPTRLKQVADNVLGNALKFTEKPGTVTVRLYRDATTGEAVLSIRDTGIGIEPGLLACLFEPFSQADRSLDRSRGGLGLGLALVQGLVDLHGGKVEAHSDGPGRGAEFVVRLPMESMPPESAPPAETPAADAARRLSVLLIEDHRDSAESLRKLLTILGHDVTVAHTGVEGVALALRTRPAVVLCDIGLPGMDGYAVAARLRGEPATASLRLIALSGYGRDEDRRRAREAGFDDYLIKPAEPGELLRKIQAE